LGNQREDLTMAKAYKSEAFAALHESMSDLHRVGALDSQTMREFDRACLTPVMKMSPAAIRRIRAKAAVSQAVFAAHLNVTAGIVSKWERGEKQPRGPAAKLLTLAAKHGIAAIA
jgi:putative transcriptional regulator